VVPQRAADLHSVTKLSLDWTQNPLAGEPMAERRGHKEGGITKRYGRDGKFLGYQVQVLLANGQRKTLGTKRTRREAVKLAQHAQVELAAGRLTTSPRQTLETYLADWLETKRPSIRYKTYVTYKTVIGHACSRIGRMRLDAVTARDIQHCEQDLGAATGPRTVQQMHMVLRQALDRAVKLDMIGRNSADAVEPPRSATPERPSLSIEQAGHLFSTTKDDRFYALYVVLTTTGVRLGEALGLQWDAVDLKDRVLLVRQELQRQTGKGLALEELKTEKVAGRCLCSPWLWRRFELTRPNRTSNDSCSALSGTTRILSLRRQPERPSIRPTSGATGTRRSTRPAYRAYDCTICVTLPRPSWGTRAFRST
jgi:hypothetical protein